MTPVFREFPKHLSYSRIAVILGLLSFAFFISGCSTETDAIVQSFQYVINRSANVPLDKLNPNFRYLRTTVNGRVVLLALGYVDADPGGPVEVWYSADREVIRLQNGRVVGAVGFSPEWREVVMRGTPDWMEMIGSGKPLEWVRVRDVMPGYRSGIVDKLASRQISTVYNTALVGIDANALLWFEDVRISESNDILHVLLPGRFDNELELPAARVGVKVEGGVASALYGEQCLSNELCLTWQRWPVSTIDQSKHSTLVR